MIQFNLINSNAYKRETGFQIDRANISHQMNSSFIFISSYLFFLLCLASSKQGKTYIVETKDDDDDEKGDHKCVRPCWTAIKMKKQLGCIN